MRLCILAFPDLIQRNTIKTWPTRLRLGANLLIFILVTIHVGLSHPPRPSWSSFSWKPILTLVGAGVSSSEMLTAFTAASTSPTDALRKMYHGVLLAGITSQAALFSIADLLMVRDALFPLAFQSITTIATSKIYRCFLVWERRYRVVAIPALLALLSLGKPFSSYDVYLL